jgi:RNA polymerase sigma-70 factor (ECF subfamily)
MTKVRPAVQPNTWRAFWATAIEGQSTQSVADELNMTSGAIYLARARVIARIRDQIRLVGDE